MKILLTIEVELSQDLQGEELQDYVNELDYWIEGTLVKSTEIIDYEVKE